MEKEDSDFMTVDEFAKRMRIGRNKAYEIVKSGEFSLKYYYSERRF